MASTVALFSAVLALTAAAPLEKRQTYCNTLAPVVDPTAPMSLYTVPRTLTNDTDGCSITTIMQGGAPITWLNIQEPDAPASGGDRFLGASDTIDTSILYSLVGGYIKSSLPIPRAEPPANATWSSINDNLYPSGSAVGGQVAFTTENEGADGGLEISGIQGAIYLDREKTPDLQPQYALWSLCDSPDGPALAFDGSSTAGCEKVYLLGCNKGNCPS